MKINSINYMTRTESFKHVAVPYPEYEKAYHNNSTFYHTAVPYPEYEEAYQQDSDVFLIGKAINKVAALFTPEVSEKSQKIKEDINKIYDNRHKQLSVYA